LFLRHFKYSHLWSFVASKRWKIELQIGAEIAYEIRYDTIRYNSVYLTCSKKLTGSQLSLPHGINKKLKCETKNKLMSVIGPSPWQNQIEPDRRHTVVMMMMMTMTMMIMETAMVRVLLAVMTRKKATSTAWIKLLSVSLPPWRM